jgi:hypothetical protein
LFHETPTVHEGAAVAVGAGVGAAVGLGVGVAAGPPHAAATISNVAAMASGFIVIRLILL